MQNQWWPPASSALHVQLKPARTSQPMHAGSLVHSPRALADEGHNGMAASASSHVHVVDEHLHAGSGAELHARRHANRKMRISFNHPRHRARRRSRRWAGMERRPVGVARR